MPTHDTESMVALRGGAARVGGRALHPVLLSNRLSVAGCENRHAQGRET